jgi:5-methylcytosine-specific restriction protein A
MARREFSKAVKVAKLKARTRDGAIWCEACGLACKRFHFDHDTPDGLTGEPTLANCRLLCAPCHGLKTKTDVTQIARAKRREARHLGVRKAPTLRSRGFAKAPAQQRASAPLSKPLPPRRGVEETP